MPENPAEQFHEIKVVPGREFSFGMGGTGKQMALLIDRKKDPKWCLTQIRTRIQKDKIKQDPALLNYGTLKLDGPAVVLTCQLEPKASLKKAMVKYFKDGGAKPVPKIRLLGPDGQEVAVGEDGDEEEGSTSGSGESEGKTLEEIKEEFKHRCEAHIRFLKPFADKTAAANGWTPPQHKEFGDLWRQAGQLWNGGKDGFYDRCFGVLEQAMGKQREFNSYAQSRLNLVSAVGTVGQSLKALAVGTTVNDLQGKLTEIKIAAETVIELGRTETALEDLKKRIGDLKNGQDGANSTIKELMPLSKKAPTNWSPSDFQAFKAQLEEAQKLYKAGSLDEYIKAATEVARLKQEGDVGQVMRPKLLQDLQTMKGRIDQLGRTPEAAEFVKSWTAIGRLVNEGRDTIGAQKKYGELQVAMNQHEAALRRAQAQKGEQGKPEQGKSEKVTQESFKREQRIFDEKRQKIAAFIEDRSVQNELEKLVKMLKAKAPTLPDEAFTPFYKSLVDLSNTVRDEVLKADLSKADELIAKAVERRKGILAQVQKALAGDVNVLNQYVNVAMGANEMIKLQKQWETGCVELDRGLQTLYDSGFPDYAAVAREIDGHKKKWDGKNKYNEALEELPQMQDLIQSSLRLQTGYAEDVIAKATRAVDAFANEVTGVRRALNARPFAVDTLKAIDQQIALARKLLTGQGNPEAAEGAVRVIEEARKLLTDISGASGNAQLYFEIKDSVAKSLEDKILKKERPERQAELNLDFGELTESPDLLDIAKELTKIREFAQDVGRAVEQAHKLSEFRETYKQRIKDFNAGIKALNAKIKTDLGPTAKPYDGTLVDDIAEMAKLLEQSSLDMDGFAKRFTVLFNKLGHLAAEKNGKLVNGEAIEKDNKQAVDNRADAEQKENARKEGVALLKKMADEFVKQCRDTRSQLIADLKKDGKKEKDFAQPEYDSIIELVGLARDTAEKDLTTAKRELDRAVKRLGRLKEQPEDVEIRAKKEVGLLPRKWAAAVGEVEKGLDNLAKAARAQLEGKATSKGEPILEADLVELETTLRDLAKPLDGADFDISLATIAGTDRYTLKQRKQAREDALRRIRFYQDYLFKNPLMRQAQANPFGVEGVISPLYKVLESLDLNVQRAVEVA